VLNMSDSLIACLLILLHIISRAEKGNLGVPLLSGKGCSFQYFTG
jgi:hypothetical protein